MKFEVENAPLSKILTDTIFVQIAINIYCIIGGGNFICVLCENCALVEMSFMRFFILVFIEKLRAGICWCRYS
jgi:hypothetical protein